MAEPFSKLTDLETLSLTLWGEARGEPILGKLAIACVIRNRSVKRDLTIKEVCLQPNQFSCFSPKGGERNYALVKERAEDVLAHDPIALTAASWLECQWIALGVMQFKIKDITGGSDHYMTTDLYDNNPPGWAKTMAVAQTFGAHTFLRSA